MKGYEYIRKELNIIANKYTYKIEDLIDVVIFWVSPVTNTIEKRSGFFNEFAEARMFSESLKEQYDKLEVPYICYILGREEYSYRSDYIDEVAVFEK